MPVSETVNRRAAAAVRIPPYPQRTPAGLGELDRVAQQIEQHLPQPRRIADQLGGHARRDFAHQSQPFLLGAGRHHLDHLLQMVAQREAGPLQLQLRGLDLGQVEDVVDQVQQVVAGPAKIRTYLSCSVLSASSPAGRRCR